MAGRLSAFSEEAGIRRRDEGAGRATAALAGELEPGSTRSGDRVEIDDPSTFSRKAGSSARCAAPTLPQAPPSVETKTMVCPTVRVESSRASSMSVAVPDALRSSPGAMPRLSRYAITTMVCWERWGPTLSGRATRLTSWVRPHPGSSAWTRCSSTARWYSAERVARPCRRFLGLSRPGNAAREPFGEIAGNLCGARGRRRTEADQGWGAPPGARP